MEEDHRHSARKTARTLHSLEDMLRSLLVESVQGSATASRRVVLQRTIPQRRDQLPQDSFLALQVRISAGRLLVSFLLFCLARHLLAAVLFFARRSSGPVVSSDLDLDSLSGSVGLLLVSMKLAAGAGGGNAISAGPNAHQSFVLISLIGRTWRLD
jgi:hypothetical protein